MGRMIHYPRPEVAAGGLLADRRLYRTRDGRLVEETSPDAAFLVAATGQPIAPETVTRLGLRVVQGRVVQGDEPDVAPLEGIVHPAGAMPEPRRRRSKGSAT